MVRLEERGRIFFHCKRKGGEGKRKDREKGMKRGERYKSELRK